MIQGFLASNYCQIYSELCQLTDWMQQCNETLFRSQSFTVCLDAEQRQTSKYFAQISVVIDIAMHYHIFVMLVPSQSPGYNYDYD